ncbi:MAG: serine/threonine-protein kinase, partial [Planctomycetota bacterium]|nr:serine/threonine-protein kinase [Planctomycetota bacterium]
MALENEQCRVLVEQGRLSDDQARYAMQALQGEQIDLCELLVTWGHIGESTAEMVRVLVTQGAQKKVFGNYEILGELSRGGMGVVYRARQRMSGRIVALKLMLDGSDPEESLRFRREAQALAKLRHRNVVSIIEFGYQDAVPYFTMELVEGKDLKSFIQDEIQSSGRPPPWEWSCKIINQVAAALEECHRGGLYHRDIKPQNILIRSDNEEPVLVDFGLVKVHAEANPGESIAMSLTAEGQLLGTPSFMAPEQFDAIKGTVGAPADVWGLAASLFYCLTGHTPFEGDSPITIFCSIKAGFSEEEFLANSHSAPKDLAGFLTASFATDAAKRPTISGFRMTLDSILNRPVSQPTSLTAKVIGATGIVVLLGLISVILLEVVSIKDSPKSDSGQAEIVAKVKTQNPIRIVFNPPVEQGVIESSSPLRVSIIGESLSKVVINGRSYSPGEKEYIVPLQIRKDATVKVTDLNGHEVSRVVKVVSRSELRKALQLRVDWNSLEDWKKILIARELEGRLKQDGYRFDSLKEFDSENETQKIAVFEHKSSGLTFHLLPGDSFIMGTGDAAATLRFCQRHSRQLKHLKFRKLIRLEQPELEATVSPFLISSYEVSTEVWMRKLKVNRKESRERILEKGLRSS